MANYRYVAKGMDGRIVRGTMEAAGESSLLQQLKEQGLFLVEARDKDSTKRYKKFASAQLAGLCREMSALLVSGISMVRALEIISEEEGISRAQKEVYIDILKDLKRGISLSEAMEARRCFPELMLGMVRSGEGSGTIDQVMSRLAKHYDRENRLNRQVQSAMTYPAVLLVMCALVVILIMTFILPQFEELFSAMESLPVPTVILMAASDFLIQEWYVALFFVLIGCILVRVLLKIRQIRKILDYGKLHMPVAGKLNKVIYTARFARTLSSLYSSGMPIVAALNTAGATVGNAYVEEQFQQVGTMVRSGAPLSQALREVDGFVLKLSSAILVGEESGKLEVMLESIAITMEDEAEAATKRLVTLLEPVLICVMALLVGFIMIAVMLPIYESYSTIEGMS